MNSPRIDVLHTLQNGEITKAFRRAGAANYIAKMSVRTSAGLDIVATASNIGIPIVYDSGMWGGRYTPRISLEDGPKPRVNLAVDLEEGPLVFAHEIGHHFLEDELSIGFQLVGTVDEPISEAFCEFFGRRMSEVEFTDDAILEAEVRDMYRIPNDYVGFIMQQAVEGYR